MIENREPKVILFIATAAKGARNIFSFIDGGGGLCIKYLRSTDVRNNGLPSP